MRRSDLLHDALYEEIEDLQFTVEGFDELLIWLNPHHKFWQHVMPADDVDPASLGDVQLTLQLRPEAFIDFSRNPVFDLSDAVLSLCPHIHCSGDVQPLYTADGTVSAEQFHARK